MRKKIAFLLGLKRFENIAFTRKLCGNEHLCKIKRLHQRHDHGQLYHERTFLRRHQGTVNVLPVFVTVLISVNLQPSKVLVMFTAFHSTLTLSVKLGVQAKPLYVIGNLTLLTNLYYWFFQ